MSPAEEEMPEPNLDVEPLVLVVEDEVLIRLAAADHLRACGFRVAEAASSAEAQELILAGLTPDVVFSDITMPGELDGIGLARWLEAQLPMTPVILTSGVTSSLEAARAACANVRHFTPKPYDYDQVATDLRGLLKRA